MYNNKDRKYNIVSLDTIHDGRGIEQIVKRAVNNVEPIQATTPILHTERSQGVLPEYDPRSDRFEIAAGAMGKVAESKLAQREAWISKLKGEQGDGATANN